MSVNTTKDLSSLFSRCCAGWGANDGHGGCNPAAGGGVADDKVDGALSYSRAKQ